MHLPKLFLTEPYTWKIKYYDFCPSWACNAKCPTCGAWKRDPGGVNLEQTNQLISQFRDLQKVVIEGGEPTMWPHLEYFVEHVDAKEIGIISNAMNPPKMLELAKRFDPKKVHWAISVNGIGKTHDISRGVKGAWNKVYKSIYTLKRYGHDVRFQFMPCKENIHELPMVAEMATRDFYGYSICYPSEAAKFGENVKWNYLNAQETQDLMMKDMPRMSRVNRWVTEIYTEKGKKKEPWPCLYGRSKIHINPKGEIRVCPFYEGKEFVIGQLYNDRVYLDERKRKRAHKSIGPQCQYESGGMCNNEAAWYGVRHSFGFLITERMKKWFRMDYRNA